MAEITTDRKLCVAQADEGQGLEVDDHVTSSSTSDVAEDKTAPALEDDLYGANEDYGEKKVRILADFPMESKKKKAALEEESIEEPGPPPYTPATADATEKSFWRRRIFLAAVGGLALAIILLAVVLGVVLSKKHSRTAGSGPSGSTGSR
jgi:hypothetical protein